MVAGRTWWTAALVSAVVVPALLAGAPAQAKQESAALAPVLEKVSPAGTIEVVDDLSCFTVAVRGRGFTPDVVTTTERGEEVHSQAVTLEAGTDQAMGVLRGAPVTVYPDANGTFEETFTPCGVTTHGSTESDFTCKPADVERGDCKDYEVGDVKQKGGRWFSRVVKVTATHDPCTATADERSCSMNRRQRDGDRKLFRVRLGEVTWPLKVTGKK
ncbi:hypothetical protein [Streptomyces erythrochromogenes]|uniref:hypothetical protein n=1 Tax=Streptomyces erythrochromogenes TaxID=285574 RepID=UPI0036ABB1DF